MSREIKKQRRLNKFWFVWNLIESIILLGGGVLSIVAGATNNSSGSSNTIESVIAFVVASFVILDGIARVVLALARYEKDNEISPIVIAGFEIALGVLLILMQIRFAEEHIFTYTVVNFVAIILMVMGALLLTYAIFIIARKMSKLFMPVVEIALAAILMGVGVVIEVLYNTEDSRQTLVLILSGTILVLAALGMFIVTLVSWNKGRKELDEAERAERGDYDVDDDGPRMRRRKAEVIEPKPAEVIDAQEEVPDYPSEDPKSISGPRAIVKRKDD